VTTALRPFCTDVWSSAFARRHNVQTRVSGIESDQLPHGEHRAEASLCLRYRAPLLRDRSAGTFFLCFRIDLALLFGPASRSRSISLLGAEYLLPVRESFNRKAVSALVSNDLRAVFIGRLHSNTLRARPRNRADKDTNRYSLLYQILLATIAYRLTCPKLTPFSLSFSSLTLAFSSLSLNPLRLSGSSL
jgi:hypothetical protein